LISYKTAVRENRRRARIDYSNFVEAVNFRFRISFIAPVVSSAATVLLNLGHYLDGSREVCNCAFAVSLFMTKLAAIVKFLRSARGLCPSVKCRARNDNDGEQ